MQTTILDFTVPPLPWWAAYDWTPGHERPFGPAHVNYVDWPLIGSAGPPTETGALLALVRAADRANAQHLRQSEAYQAHLAALQRQTTALRLHARYTEVKRRFGLSAFDALCESEGLERYDLMDLLRLGAELSARSQPSS